MGLFCGGRPGVYHYKTRTHPHHPQPPQPPKTHNAPQLATDAELGNAEKARKLEVLVPTLNNLGAARLKSRKFEQAYVVARSVSRCFWGFLRGGGGCCVGLGFGLVGFEGLRGRPGSSNPTTHASQLHQ